MHVARRRRSRIEVGGDGQRTPGIHKGSARGIGQVEEQRTEGQRDRNRVRRRQLRHILGVQDLEVVHTQRIEFRAERDATSGGELVDMDLGRQSTQPGLLEEQPGLRNQPEITLLAEDVDVVGQPFGHHGRKDLIHHVSGVGHGICPPLRHCVTTEKGGLDENAVERTQTPRHAEHFQFRLHVQAVPGLDFDDPRAHAHEALHPLERHGVQVILAHAPQRLGAVENAPAALCDFLITQSTNVVHEFPPPVRRHERGACGCPPKRAGPPVHPLR